MAEQAINDKEEELRDVREALQNVKEEAELDLQWERRAADEAAPASDHLFQSCDKQHLYTLAESHPEQVRQ